MQLALGEVPFLLMPLLMCAVLSGVAVIGVMYKWPLQVRLVSYAIWFILSNRLIGWEWLQPITPWTIHDEIETRYVDSAVWAAVVILLTHYFARRWRATVPAASPKS